MKSRVLIKNGVYIELTWSDIYVAYTKLMLSGI
jgi:hypothetical protein